VLERIYSHWRGFSAFFTLVAQLSAVVLAMIGLWQSLNYEHRAYLIVGAALMLVSFISFILLVVFNMGRSKLNGATPSGPSPPAVPPKPQLRLVNAYPKRDNRESTQFKHKLYAIILNDGGETVTVRTPRWMAGWKGAGAQTPVGIALNRELENQGGWEADKWDYNTDAKEVLLRPRRAVLTWVGLAQDMTDIDVRLREGRVGWFVVPTVIGSVEQDVILKTQSP